MFISEAIGVEFDEPPVLEKSPECPVRFVWRGETFVVAGKLDSWSDFARKGRMAGNMQPEHASIARQRGSWGVGRFHFKVRTECGRCFELYYDRAPGLSGGNRKGGWFLFRELPPA